MAEKRGTVSYLPLVARSCWLEAFPMTIALLILAFLAPMYLAIALGYAPDTPAEVTQFGDYRF